MSVADRLPPSVKRSLRPAVRRLRYVGLRPEDVLIVSFPRSGSTWLRFLLAEIVTGGDPDWGSMEVVAPIAGSHREAPKVLPNDGRLVKTHDRATGPCERAVYLVRDGRDVVLANYRWHVRGGYRGTLDEFVPRFLAGKVGIFGAWNRHVEYWLDSDIARRGNLYVVKYEDLRADTSATLAEVVRFLGVASTGDAIARAVANNDLDRMRGKEEHRVVTRAENAETNERFVGQGPIGAWTSKLTEEQLALVETALGPALIRLGYRLDAAGAPGPPPEVP